MSTAKETARILEQSSIEWLLALASSAALQAGKYIEQFDRNSLVVFSKKEMFSEAAQVVTDVDTHCEAIIKQVLAPSMKKLDIAFLGEETSSQYPLTGHPRLFKPYFWCVDPLDGTLPFIEGNAGYAVSIALVKQDGTPILGVVYDPNRHKLYQAITPCTKGKSENTRKILLAIDNAPSLSEDLSKGLSQVIDYDSKVLSVFFDRSFTQTSYYNTVLEALEQSAQKLGYQGIQIHHQAGAVINAINVLNHSLNHAPSCYFKFPKSQQGGGSLWDYAATSALFQSASELGAWVSDSLGSPLKLNNSESLFMNQHGVLFASSPEIAEQIITLYRRIA